MKQLLKRFTSVVVFLLILYFNQANLASTQLRCEDFILNSLGTFNGQYNDDLCPDNIYYLVKNIWPNLNNNQRASARVLYIYSKWTGKTQYSWKSTTFVPLRTRNGSVKHWKFHVVLLSDGYVYDFEHNSANYRVPLNVYFRDMFGAEFVSETTKRGYFEKSTQYFFEEENDPPPDLGARQLLHVRPIPAGDYKDLYSIERGKNAGETTKNYIYWLTNNSLYPEQTLESFLSNSEGG